MNSTQSFQINIGGIVISNSKCEKLLGNHNDNKLIFEPNIRSFCKKASQKLNAFARVACFVNFEQIKLLFNAFITLQFSYAPVVWMFLNRKLNNYMNHIHERTLRIIYQDHNLTFDELLAKGGSFKVHDPNYEMLISS